MSNQTRVIKSAAEEVPQEMLELANAAEDVHSYLRANRAFHFSMYIATTFAAACPLSECAPVCAVHRMKYPGRMVRLAVQVRRSRRSLL